MTNPKDNQPTYQQRERDVLLALAMQVATDPNASPEDIAAARRRLSTPDDGTVLADYAQTAPLWKLQAIAAIMAPPDADKHVIALGHRIRDVVMRAPR